MIATEEAEHKFWRLTLHTITTAALGARDVFAVDLDGDLDIDVLSASTADTVRTPIADSRRAATRAGKLPCALPIRAMRSGSTSSRAAR